MILKLQKCLLVQPKEFRGGILFLYLERWFLTHRYLLCLRMRSWDLAILASPFFIKGMIIDRFQLTRKDMFYTLCG